jgi:hypothetical protein
MLRQIGGLALLVSAVLAYNPPLDTAGPLTIRIHEPATGSQFTRLSRLSYLPALSCRFGCRVLSPPLFDSDFLSGRCRFLSFGQSCCLRRFDLVCED